MIVTVARVSDPDRFLEVFEGVGVRKRREHGCRSARVHVDPDDAHRMWSVFDWDDPDGGPDVSRQPRRFSSAMGEDAVRSGAPIVVAPAVGVETSRSMSAYTAFFNAGARADLPAPHEEVWVVLGGALRIGVEANAVTVRTGEFVHVPEQAAGVVEALEATTVVCVSVPAH